MVNRIAILVKAPPGKKIRNPLNPTHIITDERFVEVGYHRDIMKYINRGALIRGERGVDDWRTKQQPQVEAPKNAPVSTAEPVSKPQTVDVSTSEVAIDADPTPQEAVWSNAPKPKRRRRKRKSDESPETLT